MSCERWLQRWLLASTIVVFEGSQQSPPLLYPAGEGDLHAVRKLLAEGAEVNAASASGETSLHVAGIKCVADVIQTLLEARANVNAKALPGETMSMTPLHWYVNFNECGEREVNLLLNAKADVTAKNSAGDTPLDMVSKIRDRQHIAQLLRDAAQRPEL
mmetsp:Transcript_112413/g.177739  ORF Transcript_112413/g.177739 Transcript_112413/m.177739 type:complete len:159 (-) Transcript_112413:7-483(-)